MDFEILIGDCADHLAELPDDCVDAVVSDPPYGLKFMGKGWDDMGHGSAQQAWHYRWAVEALRVLKPGGHLVAFGGTRTYHRLASALEDAGFEIRDSLHWIYGSGFPKSLNVGKAIDKAAGAERQIVGRRTDGRYAHAFKGTANRPTGGPAGGGDAARIGGFVTDKAAITAPATPEAATWEGWGTALKPAHEPIVLARKPLGQTVAASVLQHGTGALNVDACRVPSEQALVRPPIKRDASPAMHAGLGAGTQVEPPGRWPPNVLLGEPAAAELDQQTPGLSIAGSSRRQQPKPSSLVSIGAESRSAGDSRIGYGDSGGASRFFPVFRYQAKAARKEREAGLEHRTREQQDPTREQGAPGGENPRNRGAKLRANPHPTVKPIALMRWLVRLVTPPGGLVLDPFTGSGTTGIAATLEGFEFLGIEQNPEYAEIARARIDHWHP